MSSTKYHGVILAAGHGSRMGPFGEHIPKPIAPICNVPLMGYQLRYLKRIGIDDVVVVIGHLGEKIKEALGDGADWGVRIRYVEQKERLGLAHAVGQLEAHLEDPFVLILGDIFFQINDPTLMLLEFERERETMAVLAVKEEPDIEALKKNFVVYLDESSHVKRVVEKPRHIPSQVIARGPQLKGCGLYVFDPAIFDAIRQTPRTAMRNEYELTHSIQILIDIGYGVSIAPVVEWDMNLTTISDLIVCNVLELRKHDLAQLCGENCEIPKGAVLEETVLGDGVKMLYPIRLTRCVALPGSVVEAESDCTDMLFTPEGALTAR